MNLFNLVNFDIGGPSISFNLFPPELSRRITLPKSAFEEKRSHFTVLLNVADRSAVVQHQRHVIFHGPEHLLVEFNPLFKLGPTSDILDSMSCVAMIDGRQVACVERQARDDNEIAFWLKTGFTSSPSGTADPNTNHGILYPIEKKRVYEIFTAARYSGLQLPGTPEKVQSDFGEVLTLPLVLAIPGKAEFRHLLVDVFVIDTKIKMAPRIYFRGGNSLIETHRKELPIRRSGFQNHYFWETRALMRGRELEIWFSVVEPTTYHRVRSANASSEWDSNFDILSAVLPRVTFISPHSAAEAHRFIEGFMRTAFRRIVIVDNYIVQDHLSRLLAQTNRKVEAILVTLPEADRKQVMKNLGPGEELNVAALKTQMSAKEGGTFWVSECREIHDRYFIADDERILYCGESVKDLGRQYGTMFRPSAVEPTNRFVIDGLYTIAKIARLGAKK